MYAAYRKEQVADSKRVRFELADDKISLFGNKEGWIPWLLEMALRDTEQQNEPYPWHLALPEALNRGAAREYSAKHYNKEVNAIVINIKPQSKKEFFLCELLDVWGYSGDGWTPMLWRLQILEQNDGDYTSGRLGDFSANEDGQEIYEFLYATGTVANGRITDTWNPPPPSSTNGVLLWPDALNYFIKSIKGEAASA